MSGFLTTLIIAPGVCFVLASIVSTILYRSDHKLNPYPPEDRRKFAKPLQAIEEVGKSNINYDEVQYTDLRGLCLSLSYTDPKWKNFAQDMIKLVDQEETAFENPRIGFSKSVVAMMSAAANMSLAKQNWGPERAVLRYSVYSYDTIREWQAKERSYLSLEAQLKDLAEDSDKQVQKARAKAEFKALMESR